MVNSTEALKLALDALENHTAIKHPQQIYYRDKAITAIKEALAQEQEPVAMLFGSLPVHDTAPSQRPEICCQQYDTCLKPCTPRGEHLAQRTWLWLTDDEICEIEEEALPWREFLIAFAKAVEDKLKKKNGYAEEKNT